MTENQFKFDKDTVATNLKTPIVYEGKRMSIGEVLDKLNELSEENQRLKAFIKRLTNNCGEIILMNGMGYNVDKILGDLE